MRFGKSAPIKGKSSSLGLKGGPKGGGVNKKGTVKLGFKGVGWGSQPNPTANKKLVK